MGDVQTLASVPAPGFPEGIVVEGNRVYVAGPATFGTAGQGPSKIFQYDSRDGHLVRTFSIYGEDLGREHALSCITTDSAGSLYVLDTQIGVLRINPSSGRQEKYAAALPHLPQCSLPPGPCTGESCDLPPGPCAPGLCGALPPGPCDSGRCTDGAALPPGPCAPVAVDRGPLSNDLAFDADGNLYITDSFQATIWRVPAGGGQPEAWYQDPRLDSSFIGPNGVRMSPDGTRVFFTQTSGSYSGVYSLPAVDDPSPMELFSHHAYGPAAGPDGIAFGASGQLYVALALSSQIDVFNATGSEIGIFPTFAQSATNTIPLDNPANIAFNGRGSALIVNHALLSGNASHMALLDMYVGDIASPLIHPVVQ